jgi:hypothetical protein
MKEWRMEWMDKVTKFINACEWMNEWMIE